MVLLGPRRPIQRALQRPRSLVGLRSRPQTERNPTCRRSSGVIQKHLLVFLVERRVCDMGRKLYFRLFQLSDECPTAWDQSSDAEVIKKLKKKKKNAVIFKSLETILVQLFRSLDKCSSISSVSTITPTPVHVAIFNWVRHSFSWQWLDDFPFVDEVSMV